MIVGNWIFCDAEGCTVKRFINWGGASERYGLQKYGGWRFGIITLADAPNLPDHQRILDYCPGHGKGMPLT